MPPDLRMVQARQQTVLNELMQAKMLRAAMSDRQLEEVLTDFWFNHFNVFMGKGQVRQYLTAYERDAIRPHVLGRFRDLLGAVAHSPAMLFYLDNFQSATPQAPQMRRPALPGRLGARVGQNTLTGPTCRHAHVRRVASTRTTREKSWSCTRWASMAATRRTSSRSPGS